MTITTSTQPLLRRSPANRSLEPGHLTPKDLRGPRTEYDRLSDVLFRLPNTTTTVRINLLPLMIHFSLIPDQNHHKIMKTVAHRCPASSAYAAAIIHSPRRPRTPLCRLAPSSQSHPTAPAKIPPFTSCALLLSLPVTHSLNFAAHLGSNTDISIRIIRSQVTSLSLV